MGRGGEVVLWRRGLEGKGSILVFKKTNFTLKYKTIIILNTITVDGKRERLQWMESGWNVLLEK